MELYAVNKYIDTRRIRNLLTAGEHNIDQVTLHLPRRYGETDVSGCQFILRCVNAQHQLLEQTLPTQVTDSEITLSWNITNSVTAVSGTVYLELRGILKDELVIKYYMPPICVRSSPYGEGTPSPDAVETTLNEMQVLVKEAKNLTGKIPKLQNGTWWFYDPDRGTYTDSGIAAAGETGADGKSAFQIWQDQGNTGTVSDFLASLKGETGCTIKRTMVYLDAQNGTDLNTGLSSSTPMQTISAVLSRYANASNLRLQLAAGTYEIGTLAVEQKKLALVGADRSTTFLTGKLSATSSTLTLSGLTISSDATGDPVVQISTGSHLYGYRVNFISSSGAECLRVTTASQCYLDGSVFTTAAETDVVVRSSGGSLVGLGYCTVPGVILASTTGILNTISGTITTARAESGGMLFTGGLQTAPISN